MKTKLPKHFVVLKLDTTVADFKCLDVEVYHSGEYCTDLLFSVHWQSSRRNQGHGWYCGRVTVEEEYTRDVPERLAKVARFLKRHPITSDVRQWITDAKLPIYVQDNRVRPQWVPNDQVIDASLSRWMALDSEECCFADTLATDEDDARNKLNRAMGEYISREAYSPEKGTKVVSEWVAAGRPVRIDRFARVPIIPSDDWMAPYGEEKPAEVSAVAVA